jgi:preprotein translocase subunit SecF
MKAVLAAFIMMGLVVFLYFGDRTTHKVLVALLSLLTAWVAWNTNGLMLAILGIALGATLVWCYIKWSIPSAAVILAAISTILFTVAVVDLIGLRISTAGIAAFLMLIGYSVDTDILLSNRVLKHSEGTVYDRITSALKTGLTMTLATMSASVIGYVFTQSDVIREIMLIICIGLVADIFYTWIQNAGFLRLWLEHHGGAR